MERNIVKNSWLTVAALILGVLMVSSAFAEPSQDDQSAQETADDSENAQTEEHSSKSAADIAAELANPNTSLGSLNFNFDYVSYTGDLPGASDQSATRMTFQPVLPYPLGNGVNLFVRPAIPVIFNQDIPTPDGFESQGVDLGDSGFDAAVAKSYPNGLMILGGVAGTIPTATDDALGNDQWALGPEAAVAVVKKWGVLGLLLSHQWDVAGSNDVDTNVTGGQYFYTFNLRDGWQISSSPTFSYNHEAPSGQRWTFPVGIGVNKTTILGGRPWKFGLQYWHYVKAPDAFGPDWQVRLTITPVVSLPW